MGINEYFGTLLQSVTETHKKHLMTGKYSDHKALNEFYDEMPELVDALIEHYQGEHGKVEDYKNMIDAEGKDAIMYLEELLKFVKDGQKELFKDESALSSDVDSIIGQIDSTLYQLRELKENSNITSLYSYLKNHMFMESFKSGTLRNFFMGLQKRGRDNIRSYYTLQWDKITDDDLKKLTKEEALKRMRSQKDPGYLLWVSDDIHTKRHWRDEKEETYQYNGITCGWDVIAVYDGDFRYTKANHIADMANYAFEVINWKKYETNELRSERRKARDGALALKDCNRIAQDNMNRYREALSNMRTHDVENLIPKFDEITEMYINVVKKYASDIVNYLQDDTPSYHEIAYAWENIEKLYNSMIDHLKQIKSYKGSHNEWAFNSYEKFNQYIVKFEKLCQQYMNNITK